MLPRKAKHKTSKQPKRRFTTQSAPSAEGALKGGRAIPLSRAFDYLEKGIAGSALPRTRASAVLSPGHEERSTARTATIHVDDEGAVLSAVQKRFTKAWKTGKYVGEHFGFTSPAALCRAITPGRWELLERLQHIGPTEIPALARALNRGTQRVRDDLAELIGIGLIEKATQDTVWVPFREIRITVVLRR